jgi:hypothetical protein
MLKHFSGTPDTIPEDEEGYKRAVCRLQLIGEYSAGRLLLDGPRSEHSNARRPTPTGLIFFVSFVVSCFAISVANYAPIAFLGTAMTIGSIVLALIKYRDWMKLPIIRTEEVEIEI